MKFLVPIDLSQNELQNARVQNAFPAPSSPEPGQIYFDTNSNVLNFYDGTGWVATGDISAASISALADVEITTVADRQFLVYDGNSSNWINSTIDLGDLNNVDTSGAATGNALVFDGTNWVPATIAYELGELTDVTLATLTAGNVLYFDGEGWVNQTLDTDDVTEGTNLYYTDGRVQDVIESASVGDLSDVDLTGLTAGDALVFDGEDWVVDRSTYQKTSEKGQADGYASLDASGKVPTTQIPDLAITDTFVVADEAARLALDVQRGDVAVQTDTGETYILAGDDPSDLGDWVLLAEPGASVRSVSGTAPISSTGGTNPTISLDDAGVTEAKIADEAVTEAKLATALANKVNAKTDSFAVLVGDGTATSFTVTHNFGTRDVQVDLYEAASPYAKVVADVDHSTTNTVTVKFATAPAQDEYRVVVVG